MLWALPAGMDPSSHTVLSVSGGRMYLIWFFWEGPSAPKNCWAAPITPGFQEAQKQTCCVHLYSRHALLPLYPSSLLVQLPYCSGLFILFSNLASDFGNRWHINRSQQMEHLSSPPRPPWRNSESGVFFSGYISLSR